MKRIALLVALVLCLPLTAHADDASRRAKAREMLQLLHTGQLLDQTMKRMMDQEAMATARNLVKNTVNPEDRAKLDDFQKKISQLMDSKMGWKALEPDYVNMYANNFTDEQLDAILAFYKSPAGVALVDKLPTLTSQAKQIAQAKMAAFRPLLKQMLDDFAKTTATERTAPAQSPH